MANTKVKKRDYVNAIKDYTKALETGNRILPKPISTEDWQEYTWTILKAVRSISAGPANLV